MLLRQLILIFVLLPGLTIKCFAQDDQLVQLSHGPDETAGGDPAYIISTAAATYYLEKTGGGLSSMIDRNGVDWLGFNKKKGSGWKGEYRGFPNAIHRQDGSYFHAMNAATDPATLGRIGCQGSYSHYIYVRQRTVAGPLGLLSRPLRLHHEPGQ